MGDTLGQDTLDHVGALWSSLVGGSGAAASPSPYVPQPGGWPWEMFALLAMAQLAMNWGLRVSAARPLAGCLFGPVPKTQTARLNDRVRRKRAARVEKFSQSAVEALFYALYFAMGFVIALRLEWFWPSVHWWNAPMRADGLAAAIAMPKDVTCFYVAYAARYLQGLVSVFLETKRKDFWEMVVHHLSTIVLIYFSFVTGMTRVGLVIMVILDFADPFLHVAKCCKYISKARRSTVRRTSAAFVASSGDGIVAGASSSLSSANTAVASAAPSSYVLWATLADVWFAGFAVSFTVTRNMMFPYVLWSCLVEAPDACRKYRLAGIQPDMDYTEMLAHAMTMEVGWCMVLLAILQVLQMIWQYFLTKAIAKVLLGEELKDMRSDSESEGRRKED